MHTYIGNGEFSIVVSAGIKWSLDSARYWIVILDYKRKQEYNPVGCLPPDFVVWGVGYHPGGMVRYPTPQDTYPRYPSPRYFAPQMPYSPCNWPHGYHFWVKLRISGVIASRKLFIISFDFLKTTWSRRYVISIAFTILGGGGRVERDEPQKQVNDSISIKNVNYIISTLLSFQKVWLYCCYINFSFYRISLFHRNWHNKDTFWSFGKIGLSMIKITNELQK